MSAAATPAVLKLTYFPIGGRIIAARLAFAIGHVPFVDERLTYDQWTAARSDRRRFPLGAIPVLQVGEHVFTESLAINQYAARLAGLGAQDPLDALRVEQALLTIEEIYTGEHGFQSTMFIENPSEKEQKRREFAERNLAVHATRLSELIDQSGTGYFGSSLSAADLTWYGVYNHFTWGDVDYVSTDLLKGFSALANLHGRVHAIPEVAEFMLRHPSG